MPDAKPKHAKRETLSKKPQYLRSTPALGLLDVGESSSRVNRCGGDFGAGMIAGASICTKGEALGHGMWLDSEFIASVNQAAMSAGNSGVKARFTNPGLSGDGLGTFLGRFKAPRMTEDGGKTLADLHFTSSAHNTPDGDLAGYVMDLASSDPDMFAVSIVFEADWAAEDTFHLQHGAKWKTDDYGLPYLCFDDFKSPDPMNAKNLPHARLKNLRAADFVDEPAANPDGLFHREQQFAQEADELAEYALGLSDVMPATRGLSIHPDRAKTFLAKFLEAHGLEITHKEKTMPKPLTSGADKPPQTDETTPPVTPPADTPPTPETDEDTPQTDEPKTEPKGGSTVAASSNDGRAECKRFISAFGAQGGQWYAEGLTFDQAQSKCIESLRAENDGLKKQIAAAKKLSGEETPVSFQPEAVDADGKDGQGDVKKYSGVLSDNLSRVAAGMKFQNPRT